MPDRRNRTEPLQAVAFLGSYVPRRCGIGTFTSDLAEAVADAAPDTAVWTVAMNDRPEGYRYPPRVWFEINQNRLGEYRLAADFLNMSDVDVCCLQHEFGLFGGNAGQHVLEFIHRLRMPVVCTMHTVLRDPDAHQLSVTRQLAEACDQIVVMAERAHGFLRDVYGVADQKVTLIPHGIPDVPFVDPSYHKDQFGVEGKKLILTFGLLGPGKGLEHMIEAMPAIVAKHPDVVYIILGATHPGVIAHSGEEYRLGLRRRARELGVDANVRFVNRYVELQELVEYLGAADIYVTPYLNEAQITSGTLAYAAGAGKAVVSTPYWHAQELLAEGRGRLVPFKDPKALGDTIIDLFDHETERHAMRKRAYQYTRQMRWHDVAEQYLDVFQTVRQERSRNPKPAAIASASRGPVSLAELPELKLDHLQLLTDDVGILSEARATVPDRESGYRVEENAKALVAALMAQDHAGAVTGVPLDLLVGRYLAFLLHAFDPEPSKFCSRMHYDRRWSEDPAEQFPEDAHGHAMWALGEAVARCQLRGHMTMAVNLFHKALPGCEQMQHPRAWAFSLIGIHAYLRKFGGDSHARRVREMLAHRLAEAYRKQTHRDWPWFDGLTYANARFPHALLLSGRWMFDNAMIETALRSLEWLWGVQTSPEGYFAPVGTEGWYPRGGEKARFNQSPGEAAATIAACLEAYHVTSDHKWIDRAERCLNWFLGDNDLRMPLYDHTTGGCADFLHSQGVSENQGAEATLAWLLSLLAMYDQSLNLLAAPPTPPAKEVPARAPSQPDPAAATVVDEPPVRPRAASASASAGPLTRRG